MATNVNEAAVGRLNADPNQVKRIQAAIGVQPTGVWDEWTDSAYADWARTRGIDPNYGMTGNAQEWTDLIQNRINPLADAGNPAMEDPAYAAYLRTMGVEQANIKNEIMARTEAVQRAINRNAAGYEQQKSERTKSVGLDFEGRGLGNSGAQYTQQNEASANIDYQRNQDESAQRDALDTANRSSQAALAQLGQRRAEEELAARQRIGEKRAQRTYNPLGQ